jgi:hypothetical protein
MSKPRLAISFSGGRTSAVMTKEELEAKRHTHDITVNFANTGEEHEATLEFVHRCDITFGFNVVWLEAVIDPAKGSGVRHKIVSFETASRKGEPFRAYIAKYGIPNMGSPQCTARLKVNVMESYLHRELGWKGGKKPNYETAIGIRADEAQRRAKNATAKRFVYPLVEKGITKDDVVREVRSWGFDLMLPGEHYGNCKWCWKKSNRKLLTLAKESPEVFDFPLKMEREFGDFKCNPPVTSPNGKRQFFRGHRSAADLLFIAKHLKDDFDYFRDKYNVFDPALDIESGCGAESCEVGASDN